MLKLVFAFGYFLLVLLLSGGLHDIRDDIRRSIICSCPSASSGWSCW